MTAAARARDEGADLIAAFLAHPKIERRDDVTAVPSPTRLGQIRLWYDPTGPRILHRMQCLRCLQEGMLLLGTGSPPGTALCVARCPKPWHCPKCEGRGTKEHTRWCEAAR
ncbi:MAG: hypothetical protein ACEQSX_13910 [Baekduiaceae bacterium]